VIIMPVNLTYPGVYIQELPSSTQPIVGVATSITAFIGRAARGPVNQPVTINSFADFQRSFGGLWNQSYLGFAVQDFYLNGGSQGIIVRLYEPSELSLATINLPVTDPSNPNAVLTLVASSLGAWGNSVQVQVTNSNGTSFELTVQDTARTESFSGLTVDGSSTSVDQVLSSQSQLVRVSGALPSVIPNNMTQPENLAGGVGPGPAQFILPTSDPTGSPLTLAAASPGIWGNNVQIIITLNDPDDPVARAIANQYGLVPNDFFNLTVIDTGTNTLEQYNNLTIVNSSQRVDQILANQSQLVVVSGSLPSAVPEATPAPNPNATPPVLPTMLTGGDDGQVLQDTTVVDLVNGQANKTGLYALENVAAFNLLCIPPYASMPYDDTNNTGGTDVGSSVITAAAVYCQQRRAFFIVDAPTEWSSVSNAVGANLPVSGDAAANAAVYFPRVQYPNVLNNNQLQTFVPCGMVAGTMANTDAQVGVWKAPAGTAAALTNVTQFTVPLVDTDIGQLNPLGINCLRNLSAVGPVVWGARTCQGNDRLASQWKYIPVRRLALYIESSLYQSTQWIVFEPNDSALWAQIRLDINSFLNQLFRQGAFQGTTPQQAYFVKCDSDTTTPTDISNGVVNILVGFAPLYPAEFVVISIQQIAGNV
jgi:phage tail sheath protein FI